MKEGTLVKHIGTNTHLMRGAKENCRLVGVLIEKMHDPLNYIGRVWKVQWTDGTTGNYVCETDLKVWG